MREAKGVPDLVNGVAVAAARVELDGLPAAIPTERAAAPAFRRGVYFHVVRLGGAELETEAGAGLPVPHGVGKLLDGAGRRAAPVLVDHDAAFN